MLQSTSRNKTKQINCRHWPAITDDMGRGKGKRGGGRGRGGRGGGGEDGRCQNLKIIHPKS